MKTIALETNRPGSVVDDAKWAGVESRDSTADFVYAVKTTGVFCRPTCRSRRPLRKNVVFFDTSREAIAAGFRPCARCRPNERDEPSDRFQLAIQKACTSIESTKSIDSLELIARSAGISVDQLSRRFKGAIGLTPTQLAKALRSERMKSSLRSNKDVAAAIYNAGFNSSGRFYEQANAALGMTPTAYRDGGRGAVLSLAIAPCSLGLVAVAASERGVAAIHLGDGRLELEASMKEEFPNAMFESESKAMTDWIAAVVDQIDSPTATVNVPLDIRATAFQAKVWTALQKIRLGDTSTYSEIAKSIGQPSAVRAVARACATNPVSIIVPCHRVIGRDGTLTGYRWGLNRKSALLRKENADGGVI